MHLPLTPGNLRDVHILVDAWRSKGFQGVLDTNTADQGYVTVITQNWAARDGSYVRIELHKITAGRGWFGRQKSIWVTRLLTSAKADSNKVTTHGCYESMTQAHAFDRAIKDVGTYMSQTRLEDYASRTGP